MASPRGHLTRGRNALRSAIFVILLAAACGGLTWGVILAGESQKTLQKVSSTPSETRPGGPGVGVEPAAANLDGPTTTMVEGSASYNELMPGIFETNVSFMLHADGSVEAAMTRPLTTQSKAVRQGLYRADSNTIIEVADDLKTAQLSGVFRLKKCLDDGGFILQEATCPLDAELKVTTDWVSYGPVTTFPEGSLTAPIMSAVGQLSYSSTCIADDVPCLRDGYGAVSRDVVLVSPEAGQTVAQGD